jgi:hypothetical protein
MADQETAKAAAQDAGGQAKLKAVPKAQNPIFKMMGMSSYPDMATPLTHL